MRQTTADPEAHLAITPECKKPSLCTTCGLISLLILIVLLGLGMALTILSPKPPEFHLGEFSLLYFNLSESSSSSKLYELNAAWNVTIICNNSAKSARLAVYPGYNYVVIGYRQKHNILVESPRIREKIYVPARGSVKINITANVNGKRINADTYSRMRKEIDGLGGVTFEVFYCGGYGRRRRNSWFEPRLLHLP